MAKSKRKTGQRAIILFDSIDLEILERLNNSNEGLGVLKLADSLEIKHKNLKPHIDKLRKLDLIHAYKSNEGKILLWTGEANMRDNFFNDLSMVTNDTKEQKKLEEDLEKEKCFREYLKKAKNLEYENEIEKSLEIDFRKEPVKENSLLFKTKYVKKNGIKGAKHEKNKTIQSRHSNQNKHSSRIKG